MRCKTLDDLDIDDNNGIVVSHLITLSCSGPSGSGVSSLAIAASNHSHLCFHSSGMRLVT